MILTWSHCHCYYFYHFCFIFHIRCIPIFNFFILKFFLAYLLIIFVCPKTAVSVNGPVPFSLSGGFPCFFLSCKANTRVYLTKTWHGPHSSKLVNCVVLCIVCVNVYCIIATGCESNCSSIYHIIYHIISYIISYHIISYHIISYHKYILLHIMCIKIRVNYTYNYTPTYSFYILCVPFFIARLQTEFCRNCSQGIDG